MVKNLNAILTLVRNRLTKETSLEEKILFFKSKGLDVSISGDIAFIKSNNMSSELSIIPSGVVFRGPEVICFHGNSIQRKTYTETKTGILLWNQNTILYDIIKGKKAYLYYDPINKWICADDKKAESPLSNLIINKIYNIEAMDPRYTYEFVLCEKGESAGLYLIAAYDNKKFFEIEWKKVDGIALRHKLLRPSVYQTEKLEESDLPITVQDQCMTKFEIYEI